MENFTYFLSKIGVRYLGCILNLLKQIVLNSVENFGRESDLLSLLIMQSCQH